MLARSVQIGTPDNTHTQPFNKQFLLFQIDFYRRKLFIFSDQIDFRTFFSKAFHSHFITHPGYNHLAISNILSAVHSKQVAIQNPDIFHAHTPDTKQIVSRRREKDRKSTRLNSSHVRISYAVFCLKKKKIEIANAIDSKT